jgi:hypothetical protein
MNRKYQTIAEAVYQTMEHAVDTLRDELAAEGIAVEKIPKESMFVELAAQVLIQAMVQERLAFTADADIESAGKQALQSVRDMIIAYRGTVLNTAVRH